ITMIGALLSLLLPTVAAVASPTPFDGDPRTAGKVTVRAHDISVSALLADIETRTGARFIADSTVADDRVTLYAHDRPLADTLQALAAFFRFAWKRYPALDGAPVYTLSQTDAARNEEAAIQQAQVDRAAARI